MKRTCKVVMVIVLIASLMALTSCDDMFTKSVMKGAARDPEKAAAALAKKSADDLVSDAGNVADASSAQAVIGALSKKSESEIKNLSPDQKKQIMSTATTAVVDMTALGSAIDFDALEDGTADESEIIKSILNNSSSTDTTCVTYILNDALPSDFDPNTDTLVMPSGMTPEEENSYKTSLTMGAVAVAASSLKGADFDPDTFMESFEGTSVNTVDEQVSALLPNGSDEDKSNLKTALMIFAALGNDDSFDPSSAFGA